MIAMTVLSLYVFEGSPVRPKWRSWSLTNANVSLLLATDFAFYDICEFRHLPREHIRSLTIT